MPNKEQSQLFEWPLRSPSVVMDIKRLGSMHQTRLSFMRQLVRRMMSEQWHIETAIFELDDSGFGTVVYRIQANDNVYSYVLFSDYLADEDRNDRVIAEQWDVTMALCMGELDAAQIDELRSNVPKQEGGRYHANTMVLSRGNKSSRNFAYVVNQLAAGQQPDMDQLAKVGYLYRTTAVYGSGKFGMADWHKVKTCCPEFANPFAAEMFNCFMLRQFSIEQVEHLARLESPATAVPLQADIKRFIGIGNSTGLGMAPYLIRHPKLISQWVLARETNLARIVHSAEVDDSRVDELKGILLKMKQHVSETTVPDAKQVQRNTVLVAEIESLLVILATYTGQHSQWSMLVEQAADNMSMETQELLNSALMELYPELVFTQYPCVDEQYQLQPEMTLGAFKQLIEKHYAWALQIDFATQAANHYFWYRSEEKMEPRIGERFNEPGEEKEMPLTIARLVHDCYHQLTDYLLQVDSGQAVAYWLATRPEFSSIVRRIQTMSQECYGEIRANLADKDMLPLDLLRCKLSFFGVSKFDPKSKLWVRNTMFQGAPVVEDIGTPFNDDWFFPIAHRGN